MSNPASPIRSSRARWTRALALTGALLAPPLVTIVAPGTAHAQSQELTETPRRRQGYFFSAGYAMGAAHTWDEGEKLGTWPGGKMALRLGQLLTPRLGLGLVIESGGSKKDKKTAGVFGMGVEGQVHLVANLSLRATVGFAALQIEDKADTDTSLRGTYGSQYGLGLAYDWFPFAAAPSHSGGFAVTPTFDVRVLPGSSAASVGGFVGVALTYWTGLPRNQLQLPESEAYR